MKIRIKVAAALAGLGFLPAAASAATIGGTFYAPQYDFAESSPPPTTGIFRSFSQGIRCRAAMPTRSRATFCR
jgi:hypothetical protein